MESMVGETRLPSLYARLLNTLRPRQNGRHFADDIFKCIFLNENVWIPIKISLKFVPKGSINYNPALVQIMARRRPGDKPLSVAMMVVLPTHICVTRPQWVDAGYMEPSLARAVMAKRMSFPVQIHTVKYWYQKKIYVSKISCCRRRFIYHGYRVPCRMQWFCVLWSVET